MASRSKERAGELASAFSIPKKYQGYGLLLADEEIDAVCV